MLKMRFCLLFISILVLVSLGAQVIFAQSAPSTPGSVNTDNDSVLGKVRKVAGPTYGNTGPSTPAQAVGSIINAALSLIGVVFLVLTVYAGYLWMTASGNDDQLKKAKGILTNSIIGLIIVLAAYIISSFVVSAVIESV